MHLTLGGLIAACAIVGGILLMVDWTDNSDQIRSSVLRLYACGYRDGAGLPAPEGEECPETARKAREAGLVPTP
jgi:hypothetical protein